MQGLATMRCTCVRLIGTPKSDVVGGVMLGMVLMTLEHSNVQLSRTSFADGP